MKRTILILLFFVGYCNSVNGQYSVVSPSPVRTPKNSVIEVLQSTEPDWTTVEKTYYKNDIAANFPGTTFLADATKTYNCHNYAWHMTDGGAYTYWMNQINQSLAPNISKYWTDGSYVEVCSDAVASRIFYYAGDHSAVKSSVSGMYESKWGQNIRVRHTPTEVPIGYAGSSRRYFASTKISGSTETLCTGSRSFSVENIPGATYSWTKSSGITVVGSSNSYQYTVQRNGSANEVAWVEVEISTPCSSTASTRRVYFNVGAVPSPSVYASWDNPLKIIVGADGVTGATSYKWYVNNVYVKSTTSVNTSLPYNGDCYTNVIVGVEVVNACGTSEKTNTNIGTAPCDNFYSISPNPAQDMITITTGEQTNISAISDASSSFENSIAQIKIYNNNQVVVKSVEYNEKRKQVQVNVSDIAEGLYFIEISNGNNRQIKKLLIIR